MSATWAEVSARLGRNAMPEALAMAVFVDKTITDRDEIAKGIADAWVMAEWPARCLTIDIWQMLWEHAATIGEEFITDSGTNRETVQALPATITLYRGCTPDGREGMSWTPDKARAKWFASRMAAVFGDGTVYKIEAPAEWVLAKFDGRGEVEYVLDPEMLFSFPDEITEEPNNDY